MRVSLTQCMMDKEVSFQQQVSLDFFECFFFLVWCSSEFMAILCILLGQTGSNKTHKMAINWLGQHTGKKKHTTKVN